MQWLLPTKFALNIADVTCCWSLQRELAKNKCTEERIEVWQRGVDTVRFNPSYRSDAMRARLSDGHPEMPLLVHVGRLGAGQLHSQSYLRLLAYGLCLVMPVLRQHFALFASHLTHCLHQHTTVTLIQAVSVDRVS